MLGVVVVLIVDFYDVIVCNGLFGDVGGLDFRNVNLGGIVFDFFF